MNIILAYRSDTWRDRIVECYSRCYASELRKRGFHVLEVGEGHDVVHLSEVDQSKYDLFLEIENGRSPSGKLRFQLQRYKATIPSAVALIDALDLKTPVLTLNGWKTVDDIKIGDWVFNPKGLPVKVIHTTPIFINRKCYEIEFDTGEKIISDGGHKWLVYDRGPSDFEYHTYKYGHIKDIKTTEELYEENRFENYFRFLLPVSEIIQFEEEKNNLFIDPYLLGLWLGDGTKGAPVITNTNLQVVDYLYKSEFSVRKIMCKGKFRHSYYLGKNKEEIAFLRQLRTLNLLHNKHIPFIYLQSSLDNRISLLQGLMDTDGECAKDSQSYFHNTNLPLIKQVRILLSSLGIKSYLSAYEKPPNEFNKKNHIIYRLSFREARTKFPLYRIKEKLDRQPTEVKESSSRNYHRIVSIKLVESVPLKCISVDSVERLFLVGKNLIPTHNSHGHPDLHKEIAPLYSHVFFAVWRKRDLFTGHPSAEWCPNATDWSFFNPTLASTDPSNCFTVGFHGSRGGLDRADVLKGVCDELGLTYDVRQIGKNYRHRWPQTCQAMLNCEYLFNKGQKKDGPNQRVMESMICGRPLFTDLDEKDGMSLLFKDGKHFLGYTNKENLKERILWAIDNPIEAQEIAINGMTEATNKHQIKHRVDQILEVVNAKN